MCEDGWINLGLFIILFNDKIDSSRNRLGHWINRRSYSPAETFSSFFYRAKTSARTSRFISEISTLFSLNFQIFPTIFVTVNSFIASAVPPRGSGFSSNLAQVRYLPNAQPPQKWVVEHSQKWRLIFIKARLFTGTASVLSAARQKSCGQMFPSQGKGVWPGRHQPKLSLSCYSSSVRISI